MRRAFVCAGCRRRVQAPRYDEPDVREADGAPLCWACAEIEWAIEVSEQGRRCLALQDKARVARLRASRSSSTSWSRRLGVRA